MEEHSSKSQWTLSIMILFHFINKFWIWWRWQLAKITLLWNRLSHESWQGSFVLQDESWTPLHHAAQDGDVEAVSKLIDSGADVDAKTKVSIICMCHTEIPLCKFLSVISDENALHLVDYKLFWSYLQNVNSFYVGNFIVDFCLFGLPACNWAIKGSPTLENADWFTCCHVHMTFWVCCQMMVVNVMASYKVENAKRFGLVCPTSSWLR